MSNTLRILITTDNHVGYKETDPIRGDDSAATFHEIMQLARGHDVDMVLQAGDLFHVNKPSKKSLYQVIRTLRQTCLGDRPCQLEVLNHGTLSIDEDLNYVNYLDPNMNIDLPVFGISGNHDDAGGSYMLSPMDVLAATGLINHYGRIDENDDISVTPVLLRKGTTKLALYGFANVRDERLFRTFRAGKVRFLSPDSMPDEWFNLLAVHQNHAPRSDTGYLPETFLPDFMDVVVWGHEHDCLIDPVVNPEMGFSVIQPGSSVATSLTEGEAKPKHVAILSITGREFTLEKIRLKTVRPFAMDTVVLSDDSGIEPGPKTKGETIRWMTARVEELIEDARREWTEAQGPDNTAECPLPLVRLRVDYSGGYIVENPTRFSNRFVDRVANVDNVVTYFRRKTTTTSSRVKGADVAMTDTVEDGIDNLKVQTLVEDFLKDEHLKILHEAGLGNAISEFVDKDEKFAVRTFVDVSLDAQLEEMLRLGVKDEGEIIEAIHKISIDPTEMHTRAGSTKPAKATVSKPAPKRTQAKRKEAAPEITPPPVRKSRAKRTAVSTPTVVSDDEADEDHYSAESDDDVVEVSSGDSEFEMEVEETSRRPPAKRAARKPRAAPQKVVAKPTSRTAAKPKSVAKSPARPPPRQSAVSEPMIIDDDESDSDDGFI